jgi:hypothetical protein
MSATTKANNRECMGVATAGRAVVANWFISQPEYSMCFSETSTWAGGVSGLVFQLQ